MNPARSLAPALVALDLSHQWIYLVAPVIGALLAVVMYWGVYGKTNGKEKRDVEEERALHLHP